jgi:hypothetical protein
MINSLLKDIENDEEELIDIKFSTTHSGTNTIFSAIIIYEAKKNLAA